MSAQPPEPPSLLDWSDDGQPRSRLYGDVYFSSVDGLAEARAVFLQGCGLPDAWAGRAHFTVGELGFGAGLSILALLDLWRATRQGDARLHIFSVEAHLIDAAQAARALAAWPELSDLAQDLVSRWPSRARGFHRIDFPRLGATLDLAVMEVAEALNDWSGPADAWFLDGFSPALNPAMWRQEVLDLVAARSAPGARAATFTVAGAVRRGLAQAGFSVAKAPGFGRKRERLEARLPGLADPPPRRRIAVIGAGVAGCAAARAARDLGAEVVVYDPLGRGAAASGNPAALVTPRLDAGLGPVAALFAQGLATAERLYEAIPGAVISRGVLQVAGSERDAGRFGVIAGSDLFAPGDMALLDQPAAAARLGEAPAQALDMSRARVISPALALAAWAPDVVPARVCALSPDADGRWRLIGEGDEALDLVDAVIVAGGLGTPSLVEGVALRPVRGQVSWVEGPHAAAAAWGGYIAPTPTGFVFGATHDRDDLGDDVRPGDHARNLETLRGAFPALAARLEGLPLQGRAGVRAATGDHLPLAGAVDEGLFLLTGFGSRGFAVAPLLAEHVAALAIGAPSPLPRALAAIVDPDRFRRRAARRGHS